MYIINQEIEGRLVLKYYQRSILALTKLLYYNLVYFNLIY